MANLSLPTTICSLQHFPAPTMFGAEFLSLDTQLVTEFSQNVSAAFYMNHGDVSVENATFCNVTIIYTHPGQGDLVTVEAWLPLDTWNGRLQTVGGGGYVAGRADRTRIAMAGAIGEGYATITTDAGLGPAWSAADWALLSPGNVDLYSLQNLASVSLNDEAAIAKQLIKSMYGRPPDYSYWSGCSQGGRQGLMLAQRYPTAYDGIVASAPAINWGELFPAMYWPQFVMGLHGRAPHPCELDELTAAAIAACDPLDDVVDGLISDPDVCRSDPFALIGTRFTCADTETEMEISETAAVVANATWSGPRSAGGDFLWYGLDYGSSLTGASAFGGVGIANSEVQLIRFRSNRIQLSVRPRRRNFNPTFTFPV